MDASDENSSIDTASCVLPDDGARKRLMSCLARNDGVVDLSRCQLNDECLCSIWRDVFHQCNETMKTRIWCLKLDHNCLRHLPTLVIDDVAQHLTVLDLSYNALSSPLDGLCLARLPLIEVLSIAHNDDVRGLPVNFVGGAPRRHPLRALDVSHNRLVHLDPIGDLEDSMLQILKAEHNCLESLPDKLGCFRNLVSMDFSGNQALRTLPKSASELGSFLYRAELENTAVGGAFIPGKIRNEGVRQAGPMAIVRWLAGRSEDELHPSVKERTRIARAFGKQDQCVQLEAQLWR